MTMRAPFDTSSDAQSVHDDAYRRLGGRERVAIQFRLSAAARAVSRAGIRFRHPTYSNDQIEMALTRLLLGDELVRKVWPDRPLVDP